MICLHLRMTVNVSLFRNALMKTESETQSVRLFFFLFGLGSAPKISELRSCDGTTGF